MSARDDLIAVKALDEIFADLRDRRLLKWLFSATPTLIGTFSDGDELRSLDADVQQEIRGAWAGIIGDALKPSGDAGEVVEGLRGQIEHVSLRLSCRMPNTDSAVYELMWRATEAANLITTLERQLATAREALRDLLWGEYESAEPGLCDCVDNHGQPYQSQFLADRIAKAEAVLTPGVSAEGKS